MRKSRFTIEQILQVLREGKAGVVKATVRRHGISEKTYYAWKAKYGGLGLPEVKRLRQLEEENTRLKKVVASQALDNQLLKELLGKDS
jgi:putative transposase